MNGEGELTYSKDDIFNLHFYKGKFKAGKSSGIMKIVCTNTARQQC
jgi:hypothetical protein